jgi:hypothetical protein
MKIQLQDVRLAFPQLWEARAAKPGQKAKFSAAFIFTKDSPAVAIIRDAMVSVAKAKWGDKWESIYNGLKAADKLAVHDGDAKSEYAGYAGNLFINASSETRPLTLGAGPDGRAPVTQSDGKLYSGAYVNALVEIWAQAHVEHGKRINASLMGVQFLRDGERLAGGTTASADDFAAIPQAAVQAAAASGKGAADLF